MPAESVSTGPTPNAAADPLLDDAAVRDALVGRVVLVTGASRGIGAATAVHLASLGADVAITARSAVADADRALAGSLQETAEEVRALGVRCSVVVADLADEDQRARIVPAVLDEFGRLDVLVNNAAAAMYAPVEQMPLRRRRVLFELNVHAPVDLIQAAVPHLRAAGGGSIVNVSSRTSEAPEGEPGVLGSTTTLHGSSKAALERITVGLAEELRSDGVAVNAVSPVRGVWTEGAAALLGDRIGREGFEPVEQMCAAIAVLAAVRPTQCTGRVLTSAQTLGLTAREDSAGRERPEHADGHDDGGPE